MNSSPLQFWTKYRLWAATVALLVLAPIVLLECQRVPDADAPTVRALAEWADAEAQRVYGPSNPDAWQAATGEMRRLDPQLPSTASWDRLFAVRVAWAPALEPDFAKLSDRMSGPVESLLGAARGGTAYRTAVSWLLEPAEETKGVSSAAADFISLQNIARWQVFVAERAAERGEWDRAMEELDEIVVLQRGIESADGIGYLIAIALRSMTYGGYAYFLQCDPPPSALLAAIARVRAMHFTDPHMTPDMTVRAHVAQFSQQRTWREKSAVGRLVPPLFTFEQALTALASHAGDLRDPGLRRWAERYQRRLYVSQSRHAVLVPGVGAVLDLRGSGLLTCTALPSARKFLRGALEREPLAMASSEAVSRSLDHPDPMTLVAFTHSSTDPVASENEARARHAALQGWVLDVALRARYFLATQDRWPETTAELDASFPLATDPLAGKRSVPFEPRRLGLRWVETRDCPDLCAALWRTLPVPFARSQSEYERGLPPSARPPLPAGMFRAQFDKHEEAILAVACQQVLARHPRLTASSEASYASGWTQQGPVRHPMDERFARAITDWAVEAHPQPGGQTPRMVYEMKPDVLTETDHVLPMFYEANAQLIAPERVLVVYSPGPTGADEGGLIPYDPTNGTRSRGDVLAFPERF